MNIIIERLKEVENCLDEMEKIITNNMTENEYTKHVEDIHIEVIKALNLLRRK